jgi:hypothetical protein
MVAKIKTIYIVSLLAMVTKIITVASSDGYLFDKESAPKLYHIILARVKNFVIDFCYWADSYLQSRFFKKHLRAVQFGFIIIPYRSNRAAVNERKIMATKTVNYTAEQTSVMVADYENGATVEQIAQNLGKSVRSVVAKLSREKVYKAKTYVTKTGETVVKKDAVADAIGSVLNMTESEIESLVKANKTALAKIFAALANSKPV